MDSLRRANISKNDILIIDDASSDFETIRLISEYNSIRKLDNSGIRSSLLLGVDQAFNEGNDIVINLDGDAIVRNDFLDVLMNLHKQFTDKLITGFHSTTAGRHKIIKQGKGWALKESVGGINMLFTRETWERYARPQMDINDNWDHRTSLASGGVICAVPSVVQHIGLDSAMGHRDQPDVADDFKYLNLPNVTLVCVDDNKMRAIDTLAKCEKDIEFADSLFICPEPKLGSKEAYSKFILNELHKSVIDDYALIVQHDGYVKNPEAWSDEFLNYDYIGATWWYKDGMNVGNGGFSLRSKKLLELTAKLNFKNYHPEDHAICRTYRKDLEAYGIKYAPEDVANKFSYEGWNQPGVWNGQFGFHGENAFRPRPNPKMEGFIINQFLGLGDILFLVPLVRKWIRKGHDVIWPVADEYFGLKEYFPDIQFVKKSLFPMPYENRTEFMHRWKYGVYRVKNLRWNKAVRMEDAMITKYTMCGEDWRMWRELTWKRNLDKENELIKLVGADWGDYCLVCEEFGNVTDGGATSREIHPGKLVCSVSKIIKMGRVPGFTLLDWAGVIENATEIHAVSSSTLYLFETLNLKCKEINLYSRKLGQRDFDYVEPLRTKKYNLHL